MIKRAFLSVLNLFFPSAGPTDQVLAATDLEAVLNQLCAWGRPKLFQTASGWYCFVEIGQDAQGTLVSVGSDIHHEQARQAADECLSRIQARHPRQQDTDKASRDS